MSGDEALGIMVFPVSVSSALSLSSVRFVVAVIRHSAVAMCA